jgi:hypothetical protein
LSLSPVCLSGGIKTIFISQLNAIFISARRKSMINKKSYRIKSQDLALFKFILEGYEGLATVTTIDRHAADIIISSSIDFSTDLDELITALIKELSLDSFRLLDNELSVS